MRTLRMCMVVWGLVCLQASMAKGYSGGDGTPDNPFQVADVNDFFNLTQTPTHWDKHFILTADIAFDPNNPAHIFTQAPIAPDESPNAGFQGTPFTGVFNGDGHVILNLTIIAPDNDFIGLFGYAGSGGKMKYLGIVNAIIQGHNYVGGLVGVNSYGVISSCHATGTISGIAAVGGLVGYNISAILSCYATGTISGAQAVGGLVGCNYRGKVVLCYSAGKPTGTSSVGGLCGDITTGGNYEDTGNFWNTDTSELLASAMGTGKTTTQMKDIQTYLEIGRAHV